MAEYMYLDYRDGNLYVNGPFIAGSSDPLLQAIEGQLDLSESQFKKTLQDPHSYKLSGMEIDIEIEEGTFVALACYIFIEEQSQNNTYTSQLSIVLKGYHPIVNTLLTVKGKVKDVPIHILDSITTKVYVYGYPPNTDIQTTQEIDGLFDKFIKRLTQAWIEYIKKEYPDLGRLL